MSGVYLWLKWVHIVSSTVLFGTGAGIAFFFWRAQRTEDVKIIAAVARDVVVADAAFTAAAVVIQPITGFLMLWVGGYPLSLQWIWVSLVLYAVIGCFWLPVVWLQVRMRDLALTAATNGTLLPPTYFHYYRWWLALGWPAFAGVLLIFWLMVTKPGP
jgi:uncharacterized membrane protein